MAMEMHIELLDVQADRVRVAVELDPHQTLRLDELVVFLTDGNGDTFGPRVLLPISGELHGAVSTTVELRSTSPCLPDHTSIRAEAWVAGEMHACAIPAHSWTDLAVHLSGESPELDPFEPSALRSIRGGDYRKLRRYLPWLANLARCGASQGLPILEPPQEDPIPQGMDLDPDCEAWLRDLMSEE